MNLPNKLTILRVIMIPFFVAALLYDGGANQNMRYVAAALFIIASLTDMLDGKICLLYTSPSPRDGLLSRMPSSA